MATYTATAKYLLRKITGSSDRAEIDDGIGALADDIDANMAGYAQGTLTALPGAGKAGRLYRTTDTGQVFMDTGAAWIEIGVAPWQPGDLKTSWLTAAPSGWLACDGSAVSRTTYAALYAAIGTSAGPGDGSTTFNVPDFRGRVFVMPDGAAGRMSANDSRGLAGGAETVTLTGQQSGLAAHNHGPARGSGFVEPTGGSPDALLTLGGTYGIDADAATGTTSNVSAAQAHTNLQPYLCGGLVLIKV